MEQLHTGVVCRANVEQGGFSQAGESCVFMGNPGSPAARAACLFQGQSSALPGHIETGVILCGITLSLGHCSVWKGAVGVPVLSGQAEVPGCLLLVPVLLPSWAENSFL